MKNNFGGNSSSKKVYYYCCKFPGCHYKTIRSGHLKRHERTHTKEKPYKCEFCSYTAARSDHLRRHVKIHYKNISASRPVIHEESMLSESSTMSSPAVSPSPVLSASSSPNLSPSDSPSTFAPYGGFLPQPYEEGGMFLKEHVIVVMVFLNFLRQCYQSQRF